jgi:hypothetical protein
MTDSSHANSPPLPSLGRFWRASLIGLFAAELLVAWTVPLRTTLSLWQASFWVAGIGLVVSGTLLVAAVIGLYARDELRIWRDYPPNLGRLPARNSARSLPVRTGIGRSVSAAIAIDTATVYARWQRGELRAALPSAMVSLALLLAGCLFFPYLLLGALGPFSGPLLSWLVFLCALIPAWPRRRTLHIAEVPGPDQRSSSVLRPLEWRWMVAATTLFCAQLVALDRAEPGGGQRILDALSAARHWADVAHDVIVFGILLLASILVLGLPVSCAAITGFVVGCSSTGPKWREALLGVAMGTAGWSAAYGSLGDGPGMFQSAMRVLLVFLPLVVGGALLGTGLRRALRGLIERIAAVDAAR